ncbi:hypothetical protein [Streptomyces sp. NBC_00448]|uniref:hypothetical protein n=1 Tax=Streptomyces sp. NBC_00448 TaxID=2903652 RepID=UPI002E1EF637
MIRKTAIRTMAVGAVLASALALPVATASASTSSAATPDTMKPAASDCWSVSPTPNNSDGYLKTNGSFHLKSGVGAGCSNINLYGSGTGFYAWCYVNNPSSGISWVYGRIQGTSSTRGWFSIDSLNFVSGSVNYC